MAKPPDHSCAERIRKLRHAKRLDQRRFAQWMGVSQPTVSAWESGKYEPPPEILIRLGAEVEYPDDIWFWRRAGIPGNRLELAVARRLMEKGKLPETMSSVVPVPLRQLGPDIIKDTGTRLPWPAALIPEPSATICLQVSHGFSRPAVNKGDLVLVDTSETEPQRLWGQLIAVHHRQLPNQLLVEFSSAAWAHPAAPWSPAEENTEQPPRLGHTNAEQLWAALPSGPPPLPAQPAVLVGWLRLECGDDAYTSAMRRPRPEERWRAVLQGVIVRGVGQGESLPLTAWSVGPWDGQQPLAPSLQEASILGTVIGWIRSPHDITAAPAGPGRQTPRP